MPSFKALFGGEGPVAHRLRTRFRSCVTAGTISLAIIGPAMFVPSGGISTDESSERAAPVHRVDAVRKQQLARFTDPLTEQQLDMFRGLGAWIDLFDVDLDVNAYVKNMKRAGVRTLYIQTGRSNSATSIDPRVGRWLVTAHDAGMKVVGWYLPFYVRHDFDVERTVAVATAEYQGHRFDGVGIDIEYRAAVRGASRWNARVVRHLKAVRRELGRGYPIASIPPTPLQMRVAPDHWAGFPWQALGNHSDAVLLMSYWSDRSGCPRFRDHCAYEFTAKNVALTRQLMGRDDVIVHVIGGVGDEIDRRQLRDFVRGAKDGSADGASLYDARTTPFAWWGDLGVLRGLG